MLSGAVLIGLLLIFPTHAEESLVVAPEVVSLSAGSEATVHVVSAEDVGEVRFYLAGPPGVSLLDASGSTVDGVLVVATSADPAVVTLRAATQLDQAATGTLIVATAREVVTAQVRLVSTPTAIRALDPIELQVAVAAWGEPNGDPIEIEDLPDGAYLDPSPECAPGHPETSIGYLSGPGAKWAEACRQASMLRVTGIDTAGSWKGTVDLAPGHDDGNLEITINARHRWVLPFFALVLGLAVAMTFPVHRSVIRPLLLQRAEHERLRRAVAAAQQRALETVREYARPDHDGGIDLLVGDSDPLLFDRRLLEAVAEFESSLDQKARENHLPGGAAFKDLTDLRAEIVSHFELLRVTARDARSSITQLRESHVANTVDPSSSPVLSAPLSQLNHPVLLNADWESARRAAASRQKHLDRLNELWERVQALPNPEREALSRDLLRARSLELDRLEYRLKQEEERADGSQAASVTTEAMPPHVGQTLPSADAVSGGPSRAMSRPWRLGIVLLVVVVGVVFFLSPKGWVDEAARVLGALAVVGGAGLLLRWTSHHLKTWALAHPGEAIRLFDWALAAAGSVVVIATGWATLFLANDTFGSAADYLGILTWGFGLGTGVQLARQLLPMPSLT